MDERALVPQHRVTPTALRLGLQQRSVCSCIALHMRIPASVHIRLAVVAGTILLMLLVATTKHPIHATKPPLRLPSQSVASVQLSVKQQQQEQTKRQEHQERQQKQSQQLRQNQTRDEGATLFNLDLWNTSAATQYKTQAELDLRPCVVVRFYEKQANALPLLLFSLLASAHPHLKALVIDTGKQPYEKLPDLLRRVNQASGKKWVHAYDKKTEDVRAAFPDFHHEDFGYVLTDMAMEDILRQTKSGSGTFQCDTLTFTNADNLYSPHFIPVMLKSIARDGHDLVASHFVSHYPFPAERSTRSFDGILASESGCGALRSGEDMEFVTSERFYPWCVDLGSVMVTTKAVEAAKIRFVIDKLRKDRTGNTLEGMVIPIADHKTFAILQMSVRSPRDFTTNADGNFFHMLASHPKISSRVFRRVLLLHL